MQQYKHGHDRARYGHADKPVYFDDDDSDGGDDDDDDDDDNYNYYDNNHYEPRSQKFLNLLSTGELSI